MLLVQFFAFALACILIRSSTAAVYGRTHLCVFIPITLRTDKDLALVRAALRSWAGPLAQRSAGALVRFVSVQDMNGTDLEPHIIRVPGDIDTDYRHLPLRILKLWAHLGSQRADECEWYMKADPDTFVNLPAVSDRLACFDSTEPHFFGAVHASVPTRPMLEHFSTLFFAHGGSGYLVSRALLPLVGVIMGGPCYDTTLKATQGDGMEDVIFSVCLRSHKVAVMNYGFLAQGSSFLLAGELEQEVIVNYHQARDALMASADGSPLQRSAFWDAQPPPLHGCLLIAHPVEDADDLVNVHKAVSSGPLASSRGRCLPTPIALARQAEVRLAAPGGAMKNFWAPAQVEILDRCFLRGMGAHPRCEWEPVPEQCFGLSFFAPAASVAECAAACCRSGNECNTFQFRLPDGCWLGQHMGCQAVVAGTAGHGWEGGMKEPG